jgi:hypothetical protein
LQRGLENGTLNKYDLLSLLIRQVAATALDEIGSEVVFVSQFDKTDHRDNATRYVGTQLERELDVGLLNGYLELDVTEMKDQNIAFHFSAARKVFEEYPLFLFTKHLGIFREITSIVAQIATLASLTSRKSWPILVLTALSPLFDKLIRLIPVGFGSDHRGNHFSNLLT